MRRAYRGRRVGEAGMTLVELLVAMAITSVVVLAVGYAFTVGLKIMAPDGAQNRLSTATNLMTAERQLGMDISQAQCLVDSSGQSTCPSVSPVSPNCSATGSLLCFRWTSSDGTAHWGGYHLASSGLLTRDELSPNPSTLGVARALAANGFTAALCHIDGNNTSVHGVAVTLTGVVGGQQGVLTLIPVPQPPSSVQGKTCP